MITVKLYGLMRVESGIRELSVEAQNLKTMFARLEAAGLNRQDLKGCYVLLVCIAMVLLASWRHDIFEVMSGLMMGVFFLWQVVRGLCCICRTAPPS